MEYLRDVILNCPLAKAKHFSNSCVGLPFGHQLQDFLLAYAQLAQELSSAPAAEQLLQQGGVDYDFSILNSPQRTEKLGYITNPIL